MGLIQYYMQSADNAKSNDIKDRRLLHILMIYLHIHLPAIFKRFFVSRNDNEPKMKILSDQVS